ncbi:MAG TPA: GNAT family N-acetyltransferase [Albitalea sp.]|nr:GNAT family N-acetyltransferase [Albitalea sp.]
MTSRSGAALRLETPRAELIATEPALAPQVLAFFQRNRDHFARWDPPTPAGFYTLRAQAERLAKGQQQFAAGEAYRYWLRLLGEPARIVGQVHFSSVVRGAFHSTLLGYGVDAEFEGRGLMHETVQAGIAEMFSARVQLHRIQAAHLAENLRSAALLARLGFEREGVARKYLYIDGAWRDHVINALLNDALDAPPSA